VAGIVPDAAAITGWIEAILRSEWGVGAGATRRPIALMRADLALMLAA
jgi:hypothetical protein